MAVQFILGRAGTGKTRHCLDRIADGVRHDPILGPPVFWLVPKQATFQNQRLLAATLGGASRARVVSFDTLGAEVMAACGGVDAPEVTPAGRRLVIGHLLRTRGAELSYYTASAHQPGLAAEVDEQFAEFERAGIDAGELANKIEAIDPDPVNDPTRRKLADLRLLMAAYDRYIGEHRLDPGRRRQVILRQIDRCPLLRGATLLVDDFYDFTAQERQLLTAVAAAVATAEVCLLLDPDHPVVRDPTAAVADDATTFHRTARAYAGLRRSLAKAGVPVREPTLLRECRRYAVGTPLCHVERHLFRPDAAGSGDAAGVELFDAPDARAEVDAVARRINDAVRVGGLRYRDVAVLVRTLADYRPLVAASFAEHGIPFFADYRRPAAHHPLLEAVRNALRVATGDWPTEAVLGLVKTGLTPLADDDADALENYVDRHRIRGRQWVAADPWPYRRNPPGADAATLAAIDAEVRRIDGLRCLIRDGMAPLTEVARAEPPPTVADLAGRVFAVLESFGVRGRLARLMTEAAAAGDLELRGEHEQVWAGLVGLFETMVDLLGGERMPLAAFARVLEDGLDGFDHAIPPPTLDQVLFGGVDRTRTPTGTRACFVMGLNDGQFPAAGREGRVLSDADRRVARRVGVELDEDVDRQLLDERFLAYVAVTRASDRLVVSRPVTAPNGKAANPSPYWAELRRLVPAAAVHSVPRPNRSDPATIGTPRQLVNALVRWVRATPSAAADGNDVWPALYQWIATDPDVAPAVVAVRDRAWAALRYHNAARLRRSTAERLFPLPMHATVGQLETMAACPFRHFARYGLGLRGPDERGVTAVDLNRVYHDVLEKVVGDLVHDRRDWCDADPAELRDRIRANVVDVGRRLRGEMALSSARNRYLLDRIERTLTMNLATMTEQHRRGTYRPLHAPLGFGDVKDPALPHHVVGTPGGGSVRLSGTIDRVDVNSRGTAFTVADYKLGGGRLPLDRVYHGLALQLLAHLLVVRDAGAAIGKRPLAPAAAFLLQLLRSPETVEHPDDARSPDDPDFALSPKPRGLIDQRAVPSLDAGLTDGASAVVSAYVKKDGGYGLRHNTDVADEAEFKALLSLVERRLGEAADRAAAGVVAVEPYLLGGETPCPRCEYRSVCRFEPGVNRYRVMTPMRRDAVLAAVVGTPTSDQPPPTNN